MNKEKAMQLSILFASSSLATENLRAEDGLPLNLSAYLMQDYDDYDGLYQEKSDEGDNNAEIRRAVLSIKPSFNKNWRSKLQINIDPEAVDIKDAYIEYRGLNWANLIIGQDKEPFGLEKLTSSRNLLSIERSMISNSLAPGRSIGISLFGDQAINQTKTNFLWQVGYFQPAAEDESSADDKGEVKALTGRLVWLPIRNSDQVLHLGLAASRRTYDDFSFRLNERLEVHSSDSLLEGDSFSADQQTLTGVEALWQRGPITASAEWQYSKVKELGGPDHSYKGVYGQIAYRLTGESRQYKGGVLGGLSPTADTGAWELTYRWSELELENEGLVGQTQSLGVNYYFRDSVKLMTNYIKGDLRELGSDEDGDAISLRLQFNF